MSMHNYANSGYIVNASEFIKHLPPLVHEKYTNAISNLDWELVEEILSNSLPSEFPPVESVFTMSEEWESETLTVGETYVVFNESDLFVKQESLALKAIKNAGITPEYQQWVTLG